MEIKAPQLPQYGIQHLYRFPYYQSRAHYKAVTGMEPPEFDVTKHVKRWADPDPQSASRTITYARVLARDENSLAIRGEDGNPVLEPLTIEKFWASRVNIPPDTHTATQDTYYPLFELDCPLRELLPEEKLVFGPMSTVLVRNTRLWNEQVELQSGAFLPRDRALLEAIGSALGVAVK